MIYRCLFWLIIFAITVNIGYAIYPLLGSFIAGIGFALAYYLGETNDRTK